VKTLSVCFVGVTALAVPIWGQKVELQKADREKILHVQTALNHLTVIEMTEPVSTVALGSPAFKVEWRENRVFVEPSEPDVSTNLFVWTPSGRFNYELDAAGTVPQMDFAIDQAPGPVTRSTSTNRLDNAAVRSSGDTIITRKTVRFLGQAAQKNHIAIYVTDFSEGQGQIFIHYSIRNGTDRAYIPGTPQVVALQAPRYHESLYTLKSSQLGLDETLLLKTTGEVPIPLASSEIRLSEIEPGQDTTGILAIKLPADRVEPTVIRLAFTPSPAGPVNATLVL
jgi:hypothetical protein